MKSLHGPALGRWLRAAALALAASLPLSAQAMPYSALYVFGDSLSDNGNAYAATGHAVPGSPDYYQGRFTNGEVAAELLARQMGVTSHNFAYGGAQTGSGNVIPGLPGLATEVGAYLGSAPSAPSDALFFVWAGANDFIFGLPADPAAAINASVGNIANAIAQLAIGAGAQHFFVPSLPNVGRTPLVAGMGPDAQFGAALFSLAFNQALAVALDSLESSLGIDIIGFDTFGYIEQVANDPALYGLSDVVGRCFSGTVLSAGVACGDPGGYLFWDDVHPTATVHALLARAMAVQLEVPEPAALALFLIGLAGLAARRQMPSLSRRL